MHQSKEFTSAFCDIGRCLLLLHQNEPRRFLRRERCGVISLMLWIRFEVVLI